jgi:DNA-directed RNA polymerase omega subunit
MAKATEQIEDVGNDPLPPEIDSRYRLIILAAKRSKQRQRGALPRIDSHEHKSTRVALEEILQGRVMFSIEDLV